MSNEKLGMVIDPEGKPKKYIYVCPKCSDIRVASPGTWRWPEGPGIMECENCGTPANNYLEYVFWGEATIDQEDRDGKSV